MVSGSTVASEARIKAKYLNCWTAKNRTIAVGYVIFDVGNSCLRRSGPKYPEVQEYCVNREE
jgi:hypothetical protein